MAKTLIQQAREGRTPPELEKVAKAEGVNAVKLRDRLARGQAVVLTNAKSPPKRLTGVGEGAVYKGKRKHRHLLRGGGLRGRAEEGGGGE